MMDRTAVIVRVIVIVVALGITGLLLEFWGMAAGIMGHYMSDTTPRAAAEPGVISVDVLPPPKAPPQAAKPAAKKSTPQ